MIETHAGWLTVDEHDRVIGVKDATINALQKRVAEVTFTRDKALIQVEVGRRLINHLTGEKERAIEWAVRLEQENAHILDASEESVNGLVRVMTRAVSGYLDAHSYPTRDEAATAGIRAVLDALADTQ